MPLLQVNDIELYYESHGTGDPLVLIGGLGLAVADVRSLITALAAAGYRVIAADNRGAGRSAKPKLVDHLGPRCARSSRPVAASTPPPGSARSPSPR
jgi:pimeloyl-ACP methyl ester carboxylesterase